MRLLFADRTGSRDIPLCSAGLSHPGNLRSSNEDRILERADLGVWAVADGMGGHCRGEEAAEIVIESLATLPRAPSSGELLTALQRANKDILQISSGTSGTTVVVFHVENGRASVHWVGDSRAYLLRAGTLKLLTRDHSVVQELLEAGLITSEQAASHPQANVITRAIGTGPQLKIDSVSLTLKSADRILLCSDGLSRSLRLSELSSDKSLLDQAKSLMANALQRDGSDNISLVLLDAI